MPGPLSDIFDRALVPGWCRVILAKAPHKDINSPQIHDSRDSASWGERPGGFHTACGNVAQNASEDGSGFKAISDRILSSRNRMRGNNWGAYGRFSLTITSD